MSILERLRGVHLSNLTNYSFPSVFLTSAILISLFFLYLVPFSPPFFLTQLDLHTASSLSLSFTILLSAAPPSCLITHGSCLKKRGREGGRGQMGGETEKERVGDRQRTRDSKCKQWAECEGTWPVSERSLLPLSASYFSRCLLSLVGLLPRKDFIWILLHLSLSPSISSTFLLSSYLSLRDCSSSSSPISPLVLLSPPFPLLPPQDVV